MNKKLKNFSKYNISIAIVFTVLSTLLVSLTFILQWKKLLVAPQFVASISFDEKVKFFKEEKLGKSPTIVVGSSVAVNNLDEALLKGRSGNQISFINFGFYGLSISELRHSLSLAIKVNGKPDTLLILSAPTDFYGCFSSVQAGSKHLNLQNLNQEDVARYILSDTPSVFYHAKYRGLWRMVNPKLMLEVRRQRNTNDTLDSLKFDSSGSVLLEVPKESISPERWQGEQWAPAMDQLSSQKNTCYDSFQKLVDYVDQSRINLVFVLSPVRQGYLNKFDPTRKKLDDHKKKIETILSQSNSIFINAHGDLQLSDKYFVDALHLNKIGAQVLTKYISENLN